MASELSPIGGWIASNSPPRFDPEGIVEATRAIRAPLHVVRDRSTGRLGVAHAGELRSEVPQNGKPIHALIATLPAVYPEWLGDRAFLEAHRVRFPYVAGAMANGIATAELVIAMARAGMLGFFGAAGLLPDRVERALDAIEGAVGGASFGANLIASPNEPALEERVASLYLARGVERVSASAYVDLTPSVVRFALSGLEEAPDGSVRRRRHVLAKVSRPEVARRFMSPAPEAIVRALLAAGKITALEAEYHHGFSRNSPG